MKKRPFKKTLGVNIDHVATLRQARLGKRPSVLRAAQEAVRGGADGITLHLREDRRHIQEDDLREIQRLVRVPVNLEMAFTPEMIAIALKRRPQKICIVPERRQELTTEGGLNAVKKEKMLTKVMPRFLKANIEVSLFIAPSFEQIFAAKRSGAPVIEIHTGAYAHASGKKRLSELNKIKRAVKLAHSLGLRVNVGHGLDFDNVAPLVRIAEVEEFNIGHALIGEAVFEGLRNTVRRMKKIITS